MSITSNITVTITQTGDIEANYSSEAVPNTAASGAISNLVLTSGTNTVTCPSTTVFQVRAALIKPPDDNTATITLKGVSGDTGILINPVNPTLLTFDTTATTTSFVLVASTTINAVQVIWS